MRFRHAFPSLALALLLSWPPARAHAAAAAPDSLPQLRALMAGARAGDPALPALAERIVARREAARGAKPARVAEALEHLGRVRLNRAEYAAADSIFRRAVTLRRAASRPDTLGLAGALAWLGEAQRVEKQLVAAESTATAALALVTAASARDTALESRLRITLGNVYAERGRGARAVEQLSYALGLVESRAHPDSLLLGQACRNLARAMSLVGDYTGARAVYARAAAVQERALGPEHPDLATTLYLSSMAASVQGDYVAQRAYAERALRIRERVFGPTHSSVAIVAATVGGALRNLGDFEGALPYYERALAIARASARPNPFDLSLALNNLGAALLMVGDGARSRALLEEARVVREKAGGPGAGRSLWSGTRLAQALALTGDRAAAAREIAASLALVDSTNIADVGPDLPDALQLQGGLALAEGRTLDALAAYARAFAFADSMLGSSSPHTLDALACRATALAEAGRDAEAWADARRLESLSREVMQSSARSLTEYESLTLERSRASGVDVMWSLAEGPVARDERARVELADAVIRARLLVLDQLADERRALPREAPEWAAEVRELESAREDLARVMVEALREDRAPDSTVTRARARRESAERTLAERSARFATGRRRSTTGFAEVAAALPPGAALVSFVRHDSPSAALREGPEGDSLRRAGRRYSALVLRSGARAPVVVRLGSAAPLEAAVSRWLEACATPPPAGAALARASERRCTALGRTVRALAWDPLAPALAGASRVFVVPDGVLHAVNFLALPRANGGYLAESGPTLHRLTAERDLLPWDDGERAGRGVLAIGGADFDHPNGGDASLATAIADGSRDARAADSTGLRFPPLPRTLEEARAIVSLWRASRSPDAAEAELLTGDAATEEAFERLAPGRRVLHVATHGFALGGPGAPEHRTATGHSRGVGAVVSGERAPAVRSRTALLPGLALAGANAPPNGTAQDGFLTAEEITSLDLSGAEWAVLSACETGLSDPGAPEAVQGLQRAFRRSGLRTVIMSLWPVDDEATRSWMTHLYAARLSQERDTAESVRAACREALRERRERGLDTHPFHWAGFVAAGDWR